MAKWLRLFDFKLLAAHHCGFKSQRWFWILSCGEAIKLAYRKLVVLLRCPFRSEIIHGRVPEVFLNQLSLKVAIWPILCRCHVKPKQKKHHPRVTYTTDNCSFSLSTNKINTLLFTFFHTGHTLNFVAFLVRILKQLMILIFSRFDQAMVAFLDCLQQVNKTFSYF
jgi:hypothetical protein